MGTNVATRLKRFGPNLSLTGVIVTLAVGVILPVLLSTSVGIVSMIGPLIGAWLAIADYNWLFAISAVASLLALFLLHWWVQEPRFAGRVEEE